MPSISPELQTILEKYGETESAVWDCHGTWIAKHAPLERNARKAKITFDAPQVIQADGLNACAAMVVFGHLGEISEWSIGEASPTNNKNAYPFAMAEKRAKDRVILKLIGLHGMVYSEIEADDFRPEPTSKSGERFGGPLNVTELKKRIRQLSGEIADCLNAEDLDMLEVGYQTEIEQLQRDLPDWFHGSVDHPRGLQVTLEEARERVSQGDI